MLAVVPSVEPWVDLGGDEVVAEGDRWAVTRGSGNAGFSPWAFGRRNVRRTQVSGPVSNIAKEALVRKPYSQHKEM